MRTLAGYQEKWRSRNQPLSETNEIGGRVGGVVLSQLNGETAKFLALQGNFKIGKGWWIWIDFGRLRNDINLAAAHRVGRNYVFFL